MELKDYQLMAYNNIKPHETEAMEKADYALGLAGEAGEVVELIKHQVMHGEELDKVKLAKELSDVLWYCAALATVYKLDLGAIAKLNLAKLSHRHDNNFLMLTKEQRRQKELEFQETIEYKKLINELFKE